MKIRSTLVPEEAPEAIRCQGGVPRRVLNIPVPEVGLKRAGIDPVICKLKARGMAQHMSMCVDAEIWLLRQLSRPCARSRAPLEVPRVR